jgi:hypothetical protein
VRSIQLGQDSSIYIGAQGEMGKFILEFNKNISYNDILANSVVLKEDLTDVWNLNAMDSILIASSGPKILSINKDNVQTIAEVENTILCMARVKNELWFYEQNAGLKKYSSNGISYVSSQMIFDNQSIVQIIPSDNDTVYILTESNGIHIFDGSSIEKWETNADAFLEKNTISCGYYSPKYGLFIGTYFKGLIALSKNGKTTLHLDVEDGIQSNNINALELAPNGVLWVGSKKGIDEVDIKNTTRRFYPDRELKGTIYDLDSWNGYWFFSSSYGLYYLKKQDYYNPLEDYKFERVKGTEGQCWGTDVIDNQLFCAHHKGALKINEHLESVPFYQEEGAWSFVKLRDEVIAVGLYSGIKLFDIKSEIPKKVASVPNFSESARILAYDKHDIIWVSHPYKNVYSFKFQEDMVLDTMIVYNADDGYNSNNRNYVYLLDSMCFISNETGVYRYNYEEQLFEKDQEIIELLGKENYVRRIIQNGKLLWSITDNFTARITRNAVGLEMNYSLQPFPNLNTQHNYIGGFENLIPLEDRFLIASEEGMLEYLIQDDKSNVYQPEIKQLISGTDSLWRIYGHLYENNLLRLTPETNHLSVYFSTPYPNNNHPYFYSTRLLSSDSDAPWSRWSMERSIQYSDLNPGNYTFQVRAKNYNEEVSKTLSYQIEITSPWYFNRWTYGLYGLLTATIIFLNFYWPRKKYKKVKEVLIKEKKQSEIDIARLKKEKLLRELEFKNKELASSTLHLVQKQQTINALKEKVDKVSQITEDQEVKKKLRELMSVFRSDMRVDEDWDKFSFHFDEVHQGFIRSLKKKFPELSSSDYKLCTYLKMNMSSKEIAPLLNISVRGVELKRYRLRKKLNMNRSEDLNEFFNNIQ